MAKKVPNEDPNTPGPARAKTARPRARRSISKEGVSSGETSRVAAPTPADEAAAETREPREYVLHGIADDRSVQPPHGEVLPIEPSEDEIRARAYQRYIARGGQHGGDFDDWLQAEEELRRR